MPTIGSFRTVNGRTALDALLEIGLSPASAVCRQNTDSGQNAQLFSCATATLLKREEKATPTVLHRVFSISSYSRSTHLATPA